MLESESTEAGSDKMSVVDRMIEAAASKARDNEAKKKKKNPSVSQGKGLLPVILQYQVPFPEGAACDDLDGVNTAAIRLHDGYQFLIR